MTIYFYTLAKTNLDNHFDTLDQNFHSGPPGRPQWTPVWTPGQGQSQGR
jgi:hypothetical protein